MHTPATEGAPEAVDYAGKVRARDRETSWDAAKAQTNGKVAVLQRLIYDILRQDGPMTDDEIRHAITGHDMPQSRSGPPTRRHELELAGWVVATEERRRSDAGKMATVWRAVLDDEPAPPPYVPEPPKPKGAVRPEGVGLRVARQFASWELGDASWADRILNAYLNPDAVQTELELEMA